MNTADKKRNLDQNALMWALLTDIANQKPWPVNGWLQWLSTSDWKDILTCAVDKEKRVAEGVSGGYVMLGLRTSKMTRAQMTELIEFILYFMGENDIKIRAPAYYQDYV